MKLREPGCEDCQRSTGADCGQHGGWTLMVALEQAEVLRAEVERLTARVAEQEAELGCAAKLAVLQVARLTARLTARLAPLEALVPLVRAMRDSGEVLAHVMSHVPSCQFSACTCGAASQQADALLGWHRVTRVVDAALAALEKTPRSTEGPNDGLA